MKEFINLQQLQQLRMFVQLQRDQDKTPRVESCVQQAFWTGNEFSVHQRGVPPYSNLSKLMRIHSTETIVNNRRKYMHPDTIGTLLPFLQKSFSYNEESLEDQIFQLISQEHKIEEKLLPQMLDHKIPEIKKAVKQMLGSWHLFRQYEQGKQWLVSGIFLHQSSEMNLHDTLLLLLQHLPFASIKELAEILNLDPFSLGRPLHELSQENIIMREYYLHGSSQERFLLTEHQKLLENPLQWKGFQRVILHKSEFIVETISSLLDVSSDYYFIDEGIIMAGFSLKKLEPKRYQLQQYQAISEANSETIFENMLRWAHENHFDLSYAEANTPIGRTSVQLVDAFVQRGYEILDGALTLSFEQPQKQKKSTDEDFLLPISYFQSFDTPEKCLRHFLQVDHQQSLLLRSKGQLNVPEIYHTCGFNDRVGYLLAADLPIVLAINPKHPKLRNVHMKILQALESRKMSTIEIKEQVNAREKQIGLGIQYLQTHRLIHKVEIDGRQLWQRMEDLSSNPTYRMDRNEAIDAAIRRVLAFSAPLTKIQLTRFLGITYQEVTEALSLLKEQEIVQEGYFTKESQEVQFRLSQHLVLESDDYYPLQIYPVEDPLGILHFTEFLQKHQELIPSKPLSPNQSSFVILQNRMIIGYIITDIQGIFEELDIKLLTRVAKDIGIVIDIGETYVQQLQSQQKLRITRINGIPITDRKFETIHFGLEVLGIDIF